MPKKSTKLRADANETAYRAMLEATGQAERTLPPSERPADKKNPEAVARGSKGGKKGGRKRAQTLSKQQRTEIARAAAQKRWEGHTK